MNDRVIRNMQRIFGERHDVSIHSSDPESFHAVTYGVVRLFLP